jgi:magnesium chelatase subunit D
MNTLPDDPRWFRAVLAVALFAVDPVGTGGVILRGLPGPVRERWLALLRELLPPSAPVRRIPLHIGDSRLLGGLDLTATLHAGRPIAERGVLAEADGGVVILPMAERLAPGTAARLAAVLDAGEVAMERDGLALRSPARLGVIALDEGLAEDERLPAVLRDRLAFPVDLSGLSIGAASGAVCTAAEVAAARDRLASVRIDDERLGVLCATGPACGVGSLRVTLLAVRAARALAALAERDAVEEEDVSLACQLVFAPRATMLPVMDEPEEQESPPEPPEPEQLPERDERDDSTEPNPDKPMEDVVLEATQAAIPTDLLARLRFAGGRLPVRTPGRAGAAQFSRRRGRPAGTRRGELRAGARLNVIATLRAAAPWQPLRRADQPAGSERRIEVRSDDFRITRFKQQARTTTLFVVDASGSAALHRLAEAKGAVELLLADCYVRRDQVALIAFRGQGAELLLPPTRSLVRAKRSLAGLPGGGGTPLAAGIEAAWALAEAVRRHGDTPVVILLTDGRANITRSGQPGRAQAAEEALTAARQLRAAGFTALLVDTSPRPQGQAEALAQAMNAQYLPLPHADAVALSRAVQVTVGS